MYCFISTHIPVSLFFDTFRINFSLFRSSLIATPSSNKLRFCPECVILSFWYIRFKNGTVPSRHTTGLNWVYCFYVNSSTKRLVKRLMVVHLRILNFYLKNIEIKETDSKIKRKTQLLHFLNIISIGKKKRSK